VLTSRLTGDLEVVRIVLTKYFAETVFQQKVRVQACWNTVSAQATVCDRRHRVFAATRRLRHCNHEYD